jgi:uncharacterized protein
VPLTRRALIMLGAAALAAPGLAGCGSGLSGTPLRVATGGSGGVYFTLGSRLAAAWHDKLDMNTQVKRSNGSVDNLVALHNNTADVAFVAADAAAQASTGLRALARIYDDYIQVLVRDESPIRSLADLRGHPVSIGSLNSGVKVVAVNLLKAAGLPETSDSYVQENLHDSLADLVSGKLDALFWSGGLPTPDITTTLNQKRVSLRMLDLSTLSRSTLPYYNVETVTGTAYPLMVRPDKEKPVSTLAVHNLLMVREDMPSDEAEALVRTLFDVQPSLAVDPNQVVSLAAQLIDRRSAIETLPIQLHDGALAYYRNAKV